MTSNELTWGDLLAINASIREVIAREDKTHGWRWALPRVAASQEAVEALERTTGRSLPGEYVRLLRHADGWPAMYQNVDLFGLSDLGSSALYRRATQLMEVIDASVWAEIGSLPETVMPIACSTDDIDLFLIATEGARAGEVIWLAGGVVDRFSDVREWFLAMLEYNRLTLAEIRSQA